jgi:ATP synthase protein I
MTPKTGRGGAPLAVRRQEALEAAARPFRTDLCRNRRPGAPRDPPGGDQRSRYGMAFRLASEFVAAVLVGAGLGWLLDRLAGTSPFRSIILLLLGFGAGTLNMARASQRMAKSGGAVDLGGSAADR